MTTSEQMRRLEALERAASAKQLEELWERDVEGLRAQAAEVAAKFGVRVDVVLENMRESMHRIAEIGEEAYEIEAAAEYGCTVEALRSGEFAARLDREHAEWKEWDRARRAEVITWRGNGLGNPMIPYRGGEPVTDGSAGTFR
jgi:hypothetical protein